MSDMATDTAALGGAMPTNAPTDAGIPPHSETAESGEAESFKLDDVTKRYFGPTDMDAAGDYISKCAGLGVELTTNFDPSEGTEDGYGITVFPISKRGNEGNETIGICVAAIPDFELLAVHEKGADFIRGVVQNNLIAQVANAVRPRADGSTAGSIPKSLTDFLERSRGRESIKAFTAVASKFVSVLRKRGISFMHAGMLRQLLQSASFAEAQFPKISQDTWLHVGNQMIAETEKEGNDGAVIRNWLENRDKTAAVEVEDDAIEQALADLAG